MVNKMGISVRGTGATVSVPEAFISTRKNRIKHLLTNGSKNVYTHSTTIESTVYLKDGTEFEIELNNPTQYIYVAEILVNGDNVSGGGIILRPGERQYLERYVSNPKRFKYVTYMADSGNSAALALNGVVEVQFKREIVQQLAPYAPFTGGWQVGSGFGTSNFRLGSTNTPNTVVNNYYSRAADDGQRNASLSTATSSTCISGGSITTGTVPGNPVETGRVEQGSTSKQTISTKTGHMFSSTPDTVVKLNIKPHLEPYKQYLASYKTKVDKMVPSDCSLIDLEIYEEACAMFDAYPNVGGPVPIGPADIRVYCVECGRKQKSTWKYCPGCGNKS